MKHEQKKLTVGSLFAGIGGFDLGFEQAGWRTVWQVEINPFNRSVLADRFPAAVRFEDVRACGAKNLSAVDCVTAGFPCQDISQSGNSRKHKRARGLEGERSGLFHEVVRILREIQPAWVVLENVPALLSSNDCQDIQVVIQRLADCGYVGFWRVLNAQYFGVPQKRQRIFVVAGLGRYPSLEFLADASPVEPIPCSSFPGGVLRPESGFAANTLQASNTSGRITLGSEVLVAEEDGWGAMVERERISALHGIPCGVDQSHWAARYGAGNAVCPAIAQWVAEVITRSHTQK